MSTVTYANMSVSCLLVCSRHCPRTKRVRTTIFDTNVHFVTGLSVTRESLHLLNIITTRASYTYVQYNCQQYLDYIVNDFKGKYMSQEDQKDS